MNSSKRPLVSVWMITYNHEKYITQAIESVLAQETNFDFELVIGEDCSSDRTRLICERYERDVPQIVKILWRDRNVGIHNNVILTLQACTGQYIAMLEGDDYWIDTKKLQKQADFLVNHPDFVMCYQKTMEIDELTGKRKVTNENDHAVTGLREILERGWFIRTGSLFFRNGILTEFPAWFYQFHSTDYMLHILIAQHGKIGFLNEVTSVYRRHEGGITQEFQSNVVAFNKRKLRLLDIIDHYFRSQYRRQIRRQKAVLYNASFMNMLQNVGGINDILYLVRLLPFISYGLISKRFVKFLLKKVA